MLRQVLFPNAHVDHSGCSEHEEVVRVMLQHADYRDLELLVDVMYQLFLAFGAQDVVCKIVNIHIRKWCAR